MTDIEKREALARDIAPDIEDEATLNRLLSRAAALILNRMYPFGYGDTEIVPLRYEEMQIQLAVELYTQRGAEGQLNHSENGISRSWPEESALLKKIVPNCGSVITGGVE
jgi:hypothetical protein